MYCINCGTELPHEANFCWKCGKPQKPDVKGEEPKWETCEVIWEDDSGVMDALLERSNGHFRANAIGPQGPFTAGKTQSFTSTRMNKAPLSNESRANQALNTFIQQLIKDGWEPVESRGGEWFNHRFHRRAK